MGKIYAMVGGMMDNFYNNNPLIVHAYKMLTENLFNDKEKFALFYLNWIGNEHVKEVLKDSLLYGDLNEEITSKCQTVEDVNVLINNKISTQ